MTLHGPGHWWDGALVLGRRPRRSVKGDRFALHLPRYGFRVFIDGACPWPGGAVQTICYGTVLMPQEARR